jgi:DNA-directed RNA polymerase specialized sigma24 family protein
MSGDAPIDLPSLLVRYADRIAVIVRHEARGLLRYETEEDLVQGAHLRALQQAGEFRWQGEAPFLSWLRRIAETHLADRREYWYALKRRSGRVLRLTRGGSETQGGGGEPEPAATATGPSTFAARRERVLLVARVLDALLPRDRDLVRWTADSVPLEDQATRLGLAYEAAGKARQRALERFRKAFALASGDPL